MIQAPLVIINFYIKLAEIVCYLLCKLWASRTRILNFIHLFRKIIEIMNGFRVFHSCNIKTFCFPMCRYAQNSFGFWKKLAQCSPSTSHIIFLYCINWTSMIDENYWHFIFGILLHFYLLYNSNNQTINRILLNLFGTII